MLNSWGRIAEQLAGKHEDTLEVAVRFECTLGVAEAPEHTPVSWGASCMLD